MTGLYTGQLPDFYEQGLESYQVSLDRALDNTFDQQVLVNPTASIERAWELQQARNRGNALTKEEADAILVENGLENDLTVKDWGITDKALNLLMERKKNELRMQNIASRGPEGHAMAHFGMGLAASVVDPLNIASAFVPVVGAGRYAVMMHKATGLLQRAAVRFFVGAVEGAVGAAAMEAPVYLAAMQEQADYTMQDVLLNVGFGTVLGGGIGAIGGRAADSIKYGIRGEPSNFERILFELDQAVPRTADEKIAARVDLDDATLNERILQASLQELSEDGADLLTRSMIQSMIRNVPADDVAKLIIEADIEADVGVRGFNRAQVREQAKDNIRQIRDIILSKVTDKGISSQIEKQMNALERRLVKQLQDTSHKELAKKMKANRKDVGKVLDRVKKTRDVAMADFEAVMRNISRQAPELEVEIDNMMAAAFADDESFIMSPLKRGDRIMQKLENQHVQRSMIGSAVDESMQPGKNRLYDEAQDGRAITRSEKGSDEISVQDAEAAANDAAEEWARRKELSSVDYSLFDKEIEDALADEGIDDLITGFDAGAVCMRAKG